MRYLAIMFLLVGCGGDLVISTDTPEIAVRKYEGLKCELDYKIYTCNNKEGSSKNKVTIQVKD